MTGFSLQSETQILRVFYYWKCMSALWSASNRPKRQAYLAYNLRCRSLA